MKSFLKGKDKLLNPISVIVLILLWMLTGFFYYQKELKSLFFLSENFGYQAIIPKDLLIEDEWKSIYFKETKIGFSHTYLRILSEKETGKYKIENTTSIFLPFGITSSKLYLHSIITLSSKRKLKNFKISIHTNKYATQIFGEMASPGILDITQKKGKEETNFRLNVPENLVLMNFFQPASRFKKVDFNKKFSFNIFNPLLMKKEKITLYPQSTIQKSDEKVHILKCKYKNINYFLWVNENGEIIKEESPIGIKLVKTTSDKAVSGLRGTNGISMRDFFSIPASIKYDDIDKLKLLEVKLKNIDSNLVNPDISGQTIVESTNNYTILRIKKTNLDKYNKIVKKTDFSKYLKGTKYIQIEAASIKKLARHLTSKSEDVNPLDNIKVILNWIQSNITQMPIISIPSAIQVLKSKMGDCNEITYLFTTLTRSSNIPTKIITGLVLLNNRFQYHMWTEVFINNKWIPVDPTLNQFPSDVTHIGLIEGGYENQMKLLDIISNIDIETVKYK